MDCATLSVMYLAWSIRPARKGYYRGLWGSKVSPTTISGLNKKAYVHIENWRNRPLQVGLYP